MVGHSGLFRFSAGARIVEQIDGPHLKQDLDKFKSRHRDTAISAQQRGEQDLRRPGHLSARSPLMPIHFSELGQASTLASRLDA